MMLAALGFSTFHAPVTEFGSWSSVGLVVVGIFPAICYYTVWWEMISIYKGRSVVGILVLVFSAIFTQGLSLLLLFLMPHIYWVARINGVPFERNT